MCGESKNAEDNTGVKMVRKGWKAKDKIVERRKIKVILKERRKVRIIILWRKSDATNSFVDKDECL